MSQLAGFAKKDDLAFFLNQLCHTDYVHLSCLAPTQDILDDFKKRKGEWETYEREFVALMEERRIEKKLDPATFEDAYLLCSEDKPHHCHRRLVVEYLNSHWGNMDIQHLY